jgi:hypothetical protein
LSHSPDCLLPPSSDLSRSPGVHTSITTHTMPSWLLKHRLGPDWAKPFVDNLYFSYLFTLRAVMKVRSYPLNSHCLRQVKKCSYFACADFNSIKRAILAFDYLDINR